MEAPEGCNAYTTPRGIRVIELDFWADTARNEEWEKKEKKLYASEKDWRRENLRDWTSAEGDCFYPEFIEIGKERYIRALPALAKLPVVRSFDFGFRRPACTWIQYAAGSDRVWWIREFMPHDLGTHDFRDCVQYLSGLLDFEALTPRSKDWIRLYASKPGAPQPPWFPSTTDYFDVSGPESYRTEASAIRATEEANAAQVFANGGIFLNMVDPPVKARVDILRRLLKIRMDGWPGIIIDPQCEEGIEMFNGALSFENVTKDNPIPSRPRKDGHYENLHDALGYGVVAVVPMEDRRPGDSPRTIIGYDGRQPVYAPSGEELGWYESRRSAARPWQRGRVRENSR